MSKRKLEDSELSPAKKRRQNWKDQYAVIFKFVKPSRKGEYFAFCKLCSCDFSIGHGGAHDIKQHEKANKHQFAVSSASTQPELNFVNTRENLDVIRSEVLFTKFLIERNLPLSVASEAGDLFRTLFPDSTIAKDYSCARTKTVAIINELATDSHNYIVERLKDGVFSIGTDGGNDSNSQLYPLVVRFYDRTKEKITTELLSVLSLSTSTSTGENIFNTLSNELVQFGIPWTNVIGFVSDNASVMMGHKKGVVAFIRREHPDIIAIGCPCHLINLAALKAADALPIRMDELLVDIFYYMDKSAKRVHRFKELQSLFEVKVHKILKHVCTRWLSLGPCINRLLEQWEPLTAFFKAEASVHLQVKQKSKPSISTTTSVHSVGKKPKVPLPAQDESIQKSLFSSPMKLYKIPKVAIDGVSNGKGACAVTYDTKSTSAQKMTMKPQADNHDQSKCSKHTSARKMKPRPLSNKGLAIYERLISKETVAYALFLKSVIPVFEVSNVQLQGNSPQIHILQDCLMNLFKDLVCRFIKPAVIVRTNDITTLHFNEENIMKNEDLNVGTECAEILEALSIRQREMFFSAVKRYFINACTYMQKKFPLKDEVLTHARVANISLRLEVSFAYIRFFLKKFSMLLLKKDGESSSDAQDKLRAQFASYQISSLTETILSCDSVDGQWILVSKMKNSCGEFLYDRLSYFMLGLLSLPHANADCERIFSSVKNNRTQFRSSMKDGTLESIMIEKTRCGKGSFKHPVSDDLLRRCKRATLASLTLNNLVIY